MPWVLSSQAPQRLNIKAKKDEGSTGVSTQVLSNFSDSIKIEDRRTKVLNRYYHMFARGELSSLVCEAAKELGLIVGSHSQLVGGVVQGEPSNKLKGIEIVQEGWERSNYYVELRCWEH